MALIYNKRQLGSFGNVNFEDGTVNGWGGTRAIFSGDSNDQIDGTGFCMRTYSRWSSAGWNSTSSDPAADDSYIPVDITKKYTLSYMVKGYQTATDGRQPQHYLGFNCFDRLKRLVRLEHCGGVGNTTLSRPLNQGDSYVYLTSSSGWPTGADITSTAYYFRALILYPPTHPYYSTPWQYSRIGTRGGADGGSGETYIRSLVQTGQGDWEGRICDRNDNNKTWNYTEPYALPAGTPIARGVAGGTYNYAFSRRVYNTSSGWQNMITTVEGTPRRNSGRYFRFGAEYVKAMILHNYAHPNAGGAYPYAETLWDRMLFIENDGKYDFSG